MLIFGLVFDGWVFWSMVSVAVSSSQEDVVAVCCHIGNYSEILLGVGTIVWSKMCF